MKDYEIFLFDADGTLFDFDQTEKVALKATLERFGLEFTENVLRLYHSINLELWKDFQDQKITQAELKVKRFATLAEAHNYNYDSSEINSFFLTQLNQGTHLIEGAVQLCQQLTASGKELFIVTNGGAKTQAARIGGSEIKDFFSKIYISEEIGSPKPNAPFFDHVFKDIGKTKATMLMIGDSLSADILGGNNAGIDTCWYNHNGLYKNSTNILPTYQIHSLDELHSQFQVK